MTKPRSVFGDASRQIERVRVGTIDQYVGPWRLIPGAQGVQVRSSFSHGLVRIPVTVDILRSENSDGRTPGEIVLGTEVSVEKDDQQVTVQNISGRNLYIQVRAR